MEDKEREDPQPDKGKGPPPGKGKPVDPGRPAPQHRTSAQLFDQDIWLIWEKLK